MTLQPKHHRFWRCLPLMLCALVGTGCACLPRIDPTGERVFVWPQSQPVVATPGVGSVQAPPVYTDPVFPAPALQPGVAASVPVVGIAEDRMAITPDRIMAPVGSEVILRAGICAKEGFLLTDQKVEWLVARESAGEIVALGGRGYCRNPLLPWNQPRKIDNQYGIGYTAKMPLLITRGTANPADDVKIEPGHAWASITSPVEGISSITAMTPTIVNWAARRATATIYWIDAQWEFPPPSISASGSQVLTTTLLRQTDRTPLAGWVVRYEVASGAAGQPGQVQEVVTGIDGRASIDVTPTGSDGSITQINMQLIRPPGMGGAAYPRLVIANGSTTINWSGGQSTPYLPDLDQPVGGEPATDQPLWGSPPSTQPIGPQSGEPYRSQPPQASTPRSTGRPALDVQVYVKDQREQAEVGGQAQFQVVIRNSGNAEATGIVLTDRYQAGLSHSPQADQVMSLKNDRVGSLAAGESRTIDLTFNVTQPGRLCHDVTVSCNEFSSGETAKGTGCVNAVQPEPRGQADFDLVHDGPRLVSVGDTAYFKINIRNTGDVPLTNLQVVADYKDPLRPVLEGTGFEFVNDSIYTRIDRLEVGATKTFEIPCSCLRAATNVCPLVRVTDGNGLSRVDDHCVEIEPRREDSDVVPGADAAQGGTLRLSISPFNDTVRAQSRIRIPFFVENTAAAPEQDVRLRIQFPPELAPDLNEQTNSAGLRARLDANNIVTYDQLAELRSNERLEFLIPVNVNKSGVVTITAELKSRAVTQSVVKTQRITIVNR